MTGERIGSVTWGMSSAPLKRWMGDALGLLLATALMLAATWEAWRAIGPFAYGGGDGKALLSEIEAFRHFASPLASNLLNPLEGMAALNTPLQLWLNPVLIPFLIFPLEEAAVFSTAVALVALVAASFVTARVFGVSRPASLIGAQWAVLAFPPFSTSIGLMPLFQLIPSIAATTALFMIAGCLLYTLDNWRVRDVLLRAAAIGGVAFYALILDPAWFVGVAFVMAPLTVVIALYAPRPKIRAARLCVVALCIAAFAAVGAIEYLGGLFGFTSRLYLSQEWGRPQDTIFASFAFHHRALMCVGAVFAVGWLLAIALGSREERRLGVVVLLGFTIFGIEVACYLLAPFDWVATIPIYHEVILLALFALAAAVGWYALGRSICAWLARLCRATVPRGRGSRPWWGLADGPTTTSGGAQSIFLAALVSPAIILWYVTAVLPGTWISHRLIGYFNEPWPQEAELVEFLRPQIGLYDNAAFRGSMLVGGYGQYRTTLTLANLWRNGVPTLNEYGTFQSPPLWYALSRTPRQWAERRYGPLPNFVGTVMRQSAYLPVRPDVDPHFVELEEAWGVRFFALARRDRPDDATAAADEKGRNNLLAAGAILRLSTPARLGGTELRAYDVYEYPHPNTGGFSPTEPIVLADAAATLNQLFEPDFDFRRSVVLTDAIDLPLAPASDVSMSFVRDGIRLQGHSEGRSLVLLPVQFSHCLTLDDSRAGQVLRANLLQTAVVFDRAIDAQLKFTFRVVSPGCRRTDLADLERLGIRNSAHDGVYWRDRHPHALTIF